MISYNHSTKALCSKIANALKVRIKYHQIICFSSDINLEFEL
jgi:hypothetical protein